MTPTEHAKAAEALLERAQGTPVAAKTALLLEASVHATLSLRRPATRKGAGS